MAKENYFLPLQSVKGKFKSFFATSKQKYNRRPRTNVFQEYNSVANSQPHSQDFSLANLSLSNTNSNKKNLN